MTSVSIAEALTLEADPVVLSYVSSGQITESERKCLEVQSPEELAKSKYDLPIEFHQKLIDGWQADKNMSGNKTRRNLRSIVVENHGKFEKYILSQKTSVMFLCESQCPNRQSRFEYIKPEVLKEAWEQRPKYNSYRDMAIQILRNETLFKLRTIAGSAESPSIHLIPYKLFSWSGDDYQERRQLDNTVWLEVYERDFKDCMETQKFKFDLEQLCIYLDQILCGTVSKDAKFIFELIMQRLEDASDLLGIYGRLKTELQENYQIVADLNKQHEVYDTKATVLEEGNRAQMLESMAEVNLVYPIQYRYQKGWYQAQADQVDYKVEEELNKLREEIVGWNDKTFQETNAMQNTLNMYYSEIEFYKSKFNDFSMKFESEYDDLDNAINYKKLSMSKLESQREYCVKQMAFYQEWMAERRERKKAEEIEAARLAYEKAEAELLKQMRLENKKRKKEAKAKKGKKK